MYYIPIHYQNPYYVHTPRCVCGQNLYQPFNNGINHVYSQEPYPNQSRAKFKDYGKEPFVIDIEDAAESNNTFRTALWTGEHLQVTLMSIDINEDIGLELHTDVDQFLRIEDGQGLVQMGDTKDNLSYQRTVTEDDAIIVPVGKWHNLTNTGNEPLKLYSIYAPPEHPFGTIHETKQDALNADSH